MIFLPVSASALVSLVCLPTSPVSNPVNPNVAFCLISFFSRRCSLDLAYGDCKGLKRPEAIRRCDKCRSWFHISCGQMGLGEAISYAEARDEALCRTCSRVSIGAGGKEPGPNVQKHLALLRSKRQHMLALLERELDSGWPDGVFDLNVSPPGGRGSYRICARCLKTNVPMIFLWVRMVASWASVPSWTAFLLPALPAVAAPLLSCRVVPNIFVRESVRYQRGQPWP